MIQHTKKCTEKLGIRYPIIQAAMAGATTPELVVAVSNAGGLGSLGAGYLTAAEIKHAIQKIRQLTDHPFAVNLFIPQPHQATSAQIQQASEAIAHCCPELNQNITPVSTPYAVSFEEQIQIIFEEKVPVFSFTFGILEGKWLNQLKSKQIQLIGTATTVSEALALEKSGVDLITLQGSEAGGHQGTFLTKEEDALIGLMSLIPPCIDQIKIPIIAAGGIMDGRGIAASMTLGAAVVQMGTAFLSCHESAINHQYKKILLSQQQDHTALTRAFSGRLARGIRNKFMDCMQTKQDNVLDYPIQNALTRPMRKKANQTNATEFMSLWAGQAAALCRDISASKLIQQLMLETKESLSSIDFHHI